MSTEKNNHDAVQKRLIAPLLSGLGGFISIYVLSQAQSWLRGGGDVTIFGH